MLRLFIPVILVVSLAGCGSGDDQLHWRFAIEEVQGSVQDAYAQRFRELISERSDGEIKVTVYPYGALGTSSEIAEMIQTGALQFAFASPGHLGSVVPEAQIFSLHFLFSDDDDVNAAVLSGSPVIHGPLADAYRQRGLHLLGMIPEGWMVWTANRPLRNLEDFRGLRIRTMVSPLLLQAYRAYGANPTAMPYAEVYSALQLNMIDAQVNPVFAIEEMSFYEQQDYMIFARHLPFVASVVTNPDFYDGLAPGHRALVDDVVAELHPWIDELQRRYNRERLDIIRAKSDIEMVELTEDERQAFIEASLPVRENYIKRAPERGREILEGLISGIRAAEVQD